MTVMTVNYQAFNAGYDGIFSETLLTALLECFDHSKQCCKDRNAVLSTTCILYDDIYQAFSIGHSRSRFLKFYLPEHKYGKTLSNTSMVKHCPHVLIYL